MNEKSGKTAAHVEHSLTVDEMQRAVSAGEVPTMRTLEDDLSIWQTVGRYKLGTVLAMAAAFSASLDGYRAYRSC